jgi:hypothetical protein
MIIKSALSSLITQPASAPSLLFLLFVVNASGLATSRPSFAGHYFSSSLSAFAVVGIAYYASTLLLSSILLLTLAGSAFSALRRS